MDYLQNNVDWLQQKLQSLEKGKLLECITLGLISGCLRHSALSPQMIATSYLIVRVKWNSSRYITACRRQCRP